MNFVNVTKKYFLFISISLLENKKFKTYNVFVWVG